MGADVRDAVVPETARTGDSVTYFYVEDRGMADHVAQQLDAPKPVRSRGTRSLRPGTIEVSIGD